MTFFDAVKRAFVGTAVATGKSPEARLAPKDAVPALSTNAISSLAYAPDEILFTLAAGGVAAVAFAPWVGVAVALVTLILVAAYRMTVRRAPGQGDYQIARSELGMRAGASVGAALLLDLTLTVAVSMAVAASYIVIAFPSLEPAQPWIALGGVVLLTLLSLRGLTRAVRIRIVSVYVFLTMLVLILVAGTVMVMVTGQLQPFESASTTGGQARVPAPAEGWAAVILVLRAFSTGSAAVTGLETPVTNASSIRSPRAKTAGRTLMFIGIVSAIGMVGILLLAHASGLAPAASGLTGSGTQAQRAVEPGTWPTPVTVLLAQSIVGAHWPAILVALVTVVILLGAGMSAFASFPRLAYQLAQDDLLPRQMRTRGERLVFSNGILLLGGFAGILVVAFGSRVTDLIQLYVVGIFMAFGLGQLGLARRANKHRRHAVRATRRRDIRHMLLAGFTSALSCVVLVTIVATRLAYGAFLAFLLIAMGAGLMLAMRRHYLRVDRRLKAPAHQAAARPDELACSDDVLPSRVHALVLASNTNRPVRRAIAYARGMRPARLECILVDTEPERTARFIDSWEEAHLPVPLTVLASPYRDVAGPLVDHIRRIRAEKPREIVAVFVPEYVVEHAWERLVHNQVVARLHSHLRLEPGIVIATVPWQIGLEQDISDSTAGQVGAAQEGSQA
ncbi:amino acid transporter [Pseudoglutamicibacter albus]|uniref:Amino acid transporter n=1 Tax=Pseudoglutamicibacter albus TaxID=98671 RepID=A0ABU1YZJ0_9MICC|nr:APC family permease [Pseudoglutamicibacter albus]MDR7293784.1 amino acid transporter [Pseudoglutamicibacter albus]